MSEVNHNSGGYDAFLTEVKEGSLVSAKVYVPDETIDDTTIIADGFPALNGPGFAVAQIELAKVEKISRDEDGNLVFCLAPVAAEMVELPADVIGQRYLVTEEQIFPIEIEYAYFYLVDGLQKILDSSLTREELYAAVRTLLREMNLDDD